MDAGQLIENGAPRQLMENKEGVFYGMCAKAGLVEDE
jgi:ABC-type multidrug transport system fused ATPase/permease subunit